jgi:DNA (cytosine-5)-methyltransferase 1
VENKMSKLTSVDLFSGIGGLSLSLKEKFKTVLYCEINKDAILVLENNMRKDFIHKAPIHNDITNLDFLTIQSLTGKKHIDLVCGGFPCTGFSSAGLRKGFSNSASFLFFEMSRIIDFLNPSFIFFENVPAWDLFHL